MTPPQVVASDLDGTLVRSDGTISDRTCDALRRIEAQGTLLVLVTGRPPRWMQPVIDRTGVSGLAICANGALLYDLGNGEVVAEHTLAAEVAADLAAAIRAELPDVSFAVENSQGFAHEPTYVPQWPAPDRRVGSLDELLTAPVAKLMVKDPAKHPELILAAVRRIAGEDAIVTFSGDSLLEISGPGISKASALAELCAERGVEAGQVLAFGDMPNDLPMLHWAGHGVAVANAHQDVLDIADEVTGSNDEDGVAQVLERMFGS
jgi:Cof subfamily protein (haloacid dehalogenase superfamily)